MQNAKYLAILNVTPDSFSDGSENFTDTQWLLEKAERLMAMGAHVLDVGAESTRPDAASLTVSEEYQRLENFLKVFCPKYDFPLSIDTRKYEVMEALLSESVFRERICFFNDVEGFTDKRKLELISYYDKKIRQERRLKLIAMHSKGAVPPSLRAVEIPDNYYLQDYPEAKSERAALELSFISFFSEFFNSCAEYEIEKSRLILDPGLGFGKNVTHSLDLIDMIPNLSSLFKVEILIGASRKSFLREDQCQQALMKCLDEEELCDFNLDKLSRTDVSADVGAQSNVLDFLTKKYNQLCYKAGARYFRVHVLV